MDGDEIERAAAAVRDGDLIVYPTETVYGLGADALDSDAVEGVFEAKDRDRSKPVSMAVPDVETAEKYTVPTGRERAFMQAFLPGPVTVVLERTGDVPDVLTAGRDRVGIRVPDHEGVLELLGQTGPLTATSANVSGTGSVRAPSNLGERVRERAAVVLDGGTTPGGGSTVVDVEAGEIHRRGEEADAVERWLSEH
ncbi:threonylcarbamoyl-AMP synthase [Halovenus sp. WSH3]|uniref:L-threonylcarbamoyladenylate synthase n=1 Tax=Halovenus carboxidivorans TaxID=2692199 RepID=A0A6B0SXV4_9EURY|nr:L-threonylcarbamoyladenylate synthase [Halovenus carboxidivorans]MXR50364.1 threonylcarbamoyl-AMP synthase [Halovenus carboxidivorans]